MTWMLDKHEPATVRYECFPLYHYHGGLMPESLHTPPAGIDSLYRYLVENDQFASFIEAVELTAYGCIWFSMRTNADLTRVQHILIRQKLKQDGWHEVEMGAEGFLYLKDITAEGLGLWEEPSSRAEFSKVILLVKGILTEARILGLLTSLRLFDQPDTFVSYLPPFDLISILPEHDLGFVHNELYSSPVEYEPERQVLVCYAPWRLSK